MGFDGLDDFFTTMKGIWGNVAEYGKGAMDFAKDMAPILAVGAFVASSIASSKQAHDQTKAIKETSANQVQQAQQQQQFQREQIAKAEAAAAKMQSDEAASKEQSLMRQRPQQATQAGKQRKTILTTPEGIVDPLGAPAGTGRRTLLGA